MAIDYSKNKYKNTTFGGTDGIVVPKGTAAQRGSAEVGQIRYNTDSNLVEQYTGAPGAETWKAVDAPPVANNVSGTINEDSDSTITITGSNFSTGAVVSITGNGVGGIPRPLATTFISSSELQAQTGASSVAYIGGESYDVKVTNTSGLASEISPAGTVDRDPIWATNSGSLGIVYDRSVAPGVEASVYTDGGTTYQVLKFLTPTEHKWTSPASTTADVLIVAGGGAGGGNLAGGGGAGGVITTTTTLSAGTEYTFNIGQGGTPLSTDQAGLSGLTQHNGQNTTAFGQTAIGGGCGGGGSSNLAPNSGGSGGGGGGYSTNSGAAGTSGQGNAGGTSGGGSPNYPGGGGGGAGGAGGNGNQSNSGAGGAGLPVSFLGTSTLYFGGGGGGASYENGGIAGNGGIGGGGGGASNTYGNEGAGGGSSQNDGQSGCSFNYQTGQGDFSAAGGKAGGSAGDNTGGGGGGAPHQNQLSGAGGSGIVAIRYPISAGVPAIDTLTLSANDPDGDNVTYNLVSGGFPQTQFSIDNITGEIKGYPSEVTNSVSNSFTIEATTPNSQNELRSFSFAVAPTPKKHLVFSGGYDTISASIDQSLGTVYNPIFKTWDQMTTSEVNVTMVDWETYPYWNNWTHAIFTSRNRPGVQWRFRRGSTIEAVVKTMMSDWDRWATSTPGFNTAGSYNVTPCEGSTNYSYVENKLQFQANNSGTEAMDLMTLGRTGGNVWSTGMFWGQIDAASNYGGVMNTPYNNVGSGGGNTGDTIYVYLEQDKTLLHTDYDNYMTPTGPLGNAQSFSYSYDGTSGIGGSPSNIASATDHNSAGAWPSDGFQQQGNDRYIQVDLGSAQKVDYTFAIGYYNGSHMSNQNLIQASNDGSTWTTVSEWSYHPGGNDTNGMLYGGTNTWNSQIQGHRYSQIIKQPSFWIPVDNSVAYRYWRIRGTNFNSSNGYQLVTNWALLRKS